MFLMLMKSCAVQFSQTKTNQNYTVFVIFSSCNFSCCEIYSIFFISIVLVGNSVSGSTHVDNQNDHKCTEVDAYPVTWYSLFLHITVY